MSLPERTAAALAPPGLAGLMPPRKILVMGLPGSGKTTFAKALVAVLDAVHLNADMVRAKYNDWDFSPEARTRQAERMNRLADEAVAEGRHVVADFVCPTQATRAMFGPDILVWMDTITAGRFADTNQMFEAPAAADFRVDTLDAERWVQRFCQWLEETQGRARQTA